jgi:lipoate-protein ligase A
MERPGSRDMDRKSKAERTGSERIKSLNVSETTRNVSTSLDMTKKVFGELHVYHDGAPYSAAMNMAIDEALLESAIVPCIRFYRWQSPALSFGYFGHFSHVAIYASERDLVRRWTGGGIVLHEQDLTYSIVVPASDAAFRESSTTIYENVHRALLKAMVAHGERAELALVAGVVDVETAIVDRGYNCFANAVRSDVMIDGHKVAGAAQRRTRGGLLQQGSVQYVDLGNGLAERFAQALSANCSECKIAGKVLKRGQALAEQKYETDAWLHKR